MNKNITIEGKLYWQKDFQEKDKPAFANKSAVYDKLYTFLKEWFNESPTLTVKTSGSTGIPKQMAVSKQKMLESARLTCTFLNLEKGDKTLLCLPLDYIAGKMIVVRSLYAGLDLYLVEPNGHPLADIEVSFDFVAMIPLQVVNSLSKQTEKERLSSIKKLIIGGGAIDDKLALALRDMPNEIYSTYGMTETLSHIALRKLNGSDRSEYYKPFPEVTIATNIDNSLIIDAPLIADGKLQTNDIVEIKNHNTFKIIGRKDNIINTGGIKVQAEVVEAELKPILKDIPYAITSLPDEKLGEIIVLVTEKKIDENLLLKISKYHRPRKIILSPIPLTETGKINRKKVKNIAAYIQQGHS